VCVCEQQQFSLVLGRVYGFLPELPHLQARGPGINLRLTKNKGVFWCKMVAHLLHTRVARAAAIFNRRPRWRRGTTRALSAPGPSSPSST